MEEERVLMEHVLDGNVSGVFESLETGADPNQLLPEGAAPLHVAAGLEIHQEAIVCLLLQYGANPNIRSSEGETPLHVSATYDRCHILKLLLLNGADPNIEDEDGQTPMDCARQAGCDVCIVNMTRAIVEEDDEEEETRPARRGGRRSATSRDHGRPSDIKEEDEDTMLAGEHTANSTHSFHTCSSDETETFSWDSHKRVGPDPIPTWLMPGKKFKSLENEECDIFGQPINKLHRVEPPHKPFQSFHEAKRVLIAKLRRGSLQNERSFRAYEWTKSVDKWNEMYGRGEDMDEEAEELALEDSTLCTQDFEPDIFDEDDLSLQLGASLSNINLDDLKSHQESINKEEEQKGKTDSGTAQQGWWFSKLKSLWPYSNRGKTEEQKEEETTAPEDSTIKYLSEEEELLETDNDELDTTLGVMLGTHRLNEMHVPKSRLKKGPEISNTQNPRHVYVFDKEVNAFLPKTSSRIMEQTAQSFDSLGVSAISHKSEEPPKPTSKLAPTPTPKPETSQIHSHIKTGTKTKHSHKKSVGRPASKKTATRVRRLSSASSTGTIQYLYTDDEEGFSLIETWFPVEDKDQNANKNQMDSNKDNENGPVISPGSSGSPQISDVSKLVKDMAKVKLGDTESKGLDSEDEVGSLNDLRNSQIRGKLVNMGQAPGPVTETTRGMYLRRLMKLEKDPGTAPEAATAKTSKKTGHNPELNRLLSGDLDSTHLQVYEDRMSEPFTTPDPSRHWREGTKKSSFNYLLLDPRITSNLPARVKIIGEEEAFKLFIQAIFYVGKGKRARPYAHFKEAVKTTNLPHKVTSAKVKRIGDIWTEGHGVVSLHVFQNVIPVEAYTREAAMIDGIGRQNLTNIKAGEYYGIASGWTKTVKQQLGVRLLHKAFRIFLSEGERHIRPSDLHDK